MRQNGLGSYRNLPLLKKYVLLRSVSLCFGHDRRFGRFELSERALHYILKEYNTESSSIKNSLPVALKSGSGKYAAGFFSRVAAIISLDSQCHNVSKYPAVYIDTYVSNRDSNSFATIHIQIALLLRTFKALLGLGLLGTNLSLGPVVDFCCKECWTVSVDAF